MNVICAVLQTAFCASRQKGNGGSDSQNGILFKTAGNGEGNVISYVHHIACWMRAGKYLVDAPPDRQQFIDPPLALLVLGVPGVLLGKQGFDLCRQRLGREGCHSARTTIFSSTIRKFVRGSYQSSSLDFLLLSFCRRLVYVFIQSVSIHSRPSNGFFICRFC